MATKFLYPSFLSLWPVLNDVNQRKPYSSELKTAGFFFVKNDYCFHFLLYQNTKIAGEFSDSQ